MMTELVCRRRRRRRSQLSRSPPPLRRRSVDLLAEASDLASAVRIRHAARNQIPSRLSGLVPPLHLLWADCANELIEAELHNEAVLQTVGVALAWTPLDQLPAGDKAIRKARHIRPPNHRLRVHSQREPVPTRAVKVSAPVPAVVQLLCVVVSRASFVVSHESVEVSFFVSFVVSFCVSLLIFCVVCLTQLRVRRLGHAAVLVSDASRADVLILEPQHS